MTSVHIHLYEGDGTTGATGYVLATPTTRRDLSAGGVALPVGTAYTLVDGEATMTLAPTGLTWCWEIREMTAAGTTRYVAVTDSGTTLEYEDLPDVDPDTLLPWTPADPEAAYQSALWTAVDDYLTENPPSGTLSGVSDGTLGTPSTGDAPVWNGTTQRWEKVSLPSTFATKQELADLEGVGPSAAGGALILPNAFPDSIYAFAGGPHSTAGLKLSADKVYLTAYNLAAGAKVRRLVLIVTTAPSQAVTVECGIWSSTAQKVVSATLSISTTGRKEIDLGSVQSLAPDTYWLCTKVLGANAYGLVLGRESEPEGVITPRGNTWDAPDGTRRGLSGTSSGTGAIATDLSGLTLAMEAASIGYGYRVA